MLFVDLATGQPTTKVQLKQRNKHMSLPEAWTDATLSALNVARVAKVAKPEPGQYQVVVNDGIEQVDGAWREKWVVQSMFSERQKHVDPDGNEVASMGDDNYAETVTVTVAEQEAEYQATLDAQAAANVRAERDRLLAETDFYALSDVTMSAEMTTYRQALRDITAHANFPNDLEDSDWPTKP